MVFTHLPSNFLLLFVPLMPTLELAVFHAARSKFVLADGRADAPVLHDGCRRRRTSAPRRRGFFPSRATPARRSRPYLPARFSAVPTLGLPFLLAGGIKIIYDLWIFAVFRHVKPPEEIR